MLLNQSVHEVFSSVVTRAPDRIALASGAAHMTYAELERRSDRIADYLRGRGITRGALVGLYTQRSMHAVAAMLGILKAGGAYVPFDPSYPAKLLQFVYQDCAPSVMMVQQSLLRESENHVFWKGEAVDIEGEFATSQPAIGVPAPAGPEDPAYVMYTSGSTGHPKGVLVPHRGILRLVVDNPFVRMGSDQVHLQLAPLAFDASTFEIWGALLNGGIVAILSAPYPTLDEIAAAIRRHQVTTLWLTAGLFHLMVDHQLEGLRPLRQLLAGGDVLSPPHVVKAIKALPGCQLINGYGPTENTTFTCCYHVPRDQRDDEPVPIGTPIAHTEVYVLDDAERPVQDGQCGELYAGGAGVAIGYVNRPALNAERFIINPFDRVGRSLMYRTGDRVRRRADGNLEFLGRVDRQVKINGKRVELDEIEATIRRSGLVEDAAVTSPVTAAGWRKIYAHVKSNKNPESVIHELRGFLKQELPEHMLPAAIIVLESLPLSPTGKVDRSKLSLPAAAAAKDAAVGRRPGSLIEAELLKIWRDVLGSESIGLDDNFFDLGGTSLQLIQVHATIRAVMQTELSIVDLFQYPRISALAAWLVRRTSSSAATSAPGALSANDRARRQQAAIAGARARASGHS